MKNHMIFAVTNRSGTYRAYTAPDGSTGSSYCRGDVGVIVGQNRSIPAILAPGYTENDVWEVVNLVDQNNVYLESVAVLGAVGHEHLTSLVLGTFNADYNGMARVYDVLQTPAYALVRYLDLPVHLQYSFRIEQQALNRCRDQVTATQVTWDENNNVTSHAHSKDLIMDMVRQDVAGQMLDSIHQDNFAEILMEGAELADYDAVIMQASGLEAWSNRVLKAMDKAAVGELKVNQVTQSKPFKKNGVVNIASLFELSDGQSVTILFHNPDATPSKLAASDILTSWKFLLNKRDVSAVLQPKSGKDVKIPDLAKRMMKLAEQNSARFVRSLAKKQEDEQKLNQLGEVEKEKLAIIAALDEEIASLQQQLDTPLADNNEPTPDPVPAPKADPEPEATLDPAPEATPDPIANMSPGELHRAEWSRSVSRNLKSAFEDGMPGVKRKIDAVLKMARTLIQTSPGDAEIVLDELQYLLNQNPELRMYEIIMPALDNVTKGKMGNKLRRLNTALRQAGAPVKVLRDSNSEDIIIFPESSKFERRVLTKSNLGEYKSMYKPGEYGMLLDALAKYLNEDPEVVGQPVLFSFDSKIIDTASRQLSEEVKQFLLERIDLKEPVAAQDPAPQADPEPQTDPVQDIPATDPVEMTMEEWKDIPKDYKMIDGGIRWTMTVDGKRQVKIVKKQKEAPAAEPLNNPEPTQDNAVNPDEQWLNQIINGEIDAGTVAMSQFNELAQKYMTDPAAPIFQKMNDALTVVTKAKVAKAKAA